MDQFPYFEFTLAFSTIVYLFETYLDWRQHQHLLTATKPAILKEAVTDEKFKQTKLYGLDKSRFRFVRSAFSQVQFMTLILVGALPWAWEFSGKILEAWFGIAPDSEIPHSLAFASFLHLYFALVGLPFDIYAIFVLEARHGFNRQTPLLYFTDQIKGLLLSAVIGLPLLALLLAIIRWGGDHFYVYVWGFLLVFQLLALLLYPVLIQPLFNTITPLVEGPLRSAIEHLAKQIEFPLTKIFVIDGSKRSSHSNAYFYGFAGFGKRIVLYDTLLAQATNDEILAVLAHEFGHWKFNHTLQLFFISQVHLFLIFYLFGFTLANRAMFIAFGFDGTQMPVIIGLILFSFLYSALEPILGLLMNMLSRHCEYQADAYAASRGFGTQLQNGLIKLHLENLGDMNPDRWYSTYHYSHPSLVERLSALRVKSTSKQQLR